MGEHGQPIDVAISATNFVAYITTLVVAEPRQFQRNRELFRRHGSSHQQNTNVSGALLCARRPRPRQRRASDDFDKVAPLHVGIRASRQRVTTKEYIQEIEIRANLGACWAFAATGQPNRRAAENCDEITPPHAMPPISWMPEDQMADHSSKAIAASRGVGASDVFLGSRPALPSGFHRPQSVSAAPRFRPRGEWIATMPVRARKGPMHSSNYRPHYSMTSSAWEYRLGLVQFSSFRRSKTRVGRPAISQLCFCAQPIRHNTDQDEQALSTPLRGSVSPRQLAFALLDRFLVRTEVEAFLSDRHSASLAMLCHNSNSTIGQVLDRIYLAWRSPLGSRANHQHSVDPSSHAWPQVTANPSIACRP